MRREYDRVKGSICRNYDEIEGVTVSVSRNLNMLSEITTRKKVKNCIEYRRGRQHGCRSRQ